MAKYKAKDTYKDLKKENNFAGKGSASTHIRLLDGLVVEIPKAIKLDKKLKDTLVEVKGDK